MSCSCHKIVLRLWPSYLVLFLTGTITPFMTASLDILALNRILDLGEITPYFQPIYDLISGDVYGHEALARGPQDSLLHRPDQLFQTAIACDKLHPLELLCREKSLAQFSELSLPGKLFLNVSASLLGSPDHQNGMTLSMLEKLNISRERIVIELSEQHPFDHHGLSRSAVEHYRRMGFRIAIDDLGVGYSGLRLWSELQPEYVKIDKHFIQNVDQDSVKREFVRSIITIANSLQCDIIAEGIETQSELDQLLELGITKGQGFLLGRPTPTPHIFHSTYLEENARLVQEKFRLGDEETVHSLSRQVPTVNEDSLLKEISQMFRRDPELIAVPVLRSGIPLGVIRRNHLLELFSAQYGRALYEHKTAVHLLSTDVPIVETWVSLAKVSNQLTNQESQLNNEIIVVQDGFYVGMGSLKDLLKRITELKIQNATYSNPLTLLPGNVPIHRELERRIKQKTPFHVAYFDLNDFKPFNDYFGYAKGDQVIQLVGRLIKQYLTHSEHFIGHIGGDDFVVLFGNTDWQSGCQKVLNAFAEQVLPYYSDAEQKAGGIHAPNRKNEVLFHPILSLAIGVLSPVPAHCSSHHDIAELAAHAKKEAKRQGGNCLYIAQAR